MNRVTFVCEKCELYYVAMSGSYRACRKWTPDVGCDVGGFGDYIKNLPEKFEERPVPSGCKFNFEHKVMRGYVVEQEVVKNNMMSKFKNWLKGIFK